MTKSSRFLKRFFILFSLCQLLSTASLFSQSQGSQQNATASSQTSSQSELQSMTRRQLLESLSTALKDLQSRYSRLETYSKKNEKQVAELQLQQAESEKKQKDSEKASQKQYESLMNLKDGKIAELSEQVNKLSADADAIEAKIKKQKMEGTIIGVVGSITCVGCGAVCLYDSLSGTKSVTEGIAGTGLVMAGCGIGYFTFKIILGR